jgi:hypothetical protein
MTPRLQKTNLTHPLTQIPLIQLLREHRQKKVDSCEMAHEGQEEGKQQIHPQTGQHQHREDEEGVEFGFQLEGFDEEVLQGVRAREGVLDHDHE